MTEWQHEAPELSRSFIPRKLKDNANFNHRVYKDTGTQEKGQRNRGTGGYMTQGHRDTGTPPI